MKKMKFHYWDGERMELWQARLNTELKNEFGISDSRMARRVISALNAEFFADGYIIETLLFGQLVYLLVGTRLNSRVERETGQMLGVRDATVTAYFYTVLPDGGGNGFHMFTEYFTVLGVPFEDQYKNALDMVEYHVREEEAKYER